LVADSTFLRLGKKEATLPRVDSLNSAGMFYPVNVMMMEIIVVKRGFFDLLQCF